MKKKFRNFRNMTDYNKSQKPADQADETPRIHEEVPEGVTVGDVLPDGDDNTIAEAEAYEDGSELESLKNLLDQKEQELEKEKKEYLFLMADFDNFRKRTLKEKSELIKNAAEGAMKGLLPIIDDFERGISAGEQTDDINAVREGMTLIYNKLVKYLEQNGVKVIESDGKDFDTELHEAVAMVPTDDEEKKNKVIDTMSKGYTLNGKVIRHAKVAVAQ